MGNCFNISNNTNLNYKEFCPLRVATLYADIDESINKRKKIETMIEYFISPYHGYNIDVLCIQGIRNYKILKEIIYAFKAYIDKYNEKQFIYNNAITLDFYPNIEYETKTDINDIFWSTSESENIEIYYDKLIISRYPILQSADIPIGTNKNINNIIFINSDSDEFCNIYKYVQFVNLNINGTLVSIYNIELEEDTLGISNNKERHIQLHELKQIIEKNKLKTADPDVRQYNHGDDTFIATNRDIHIITGMFHINEIKNNSFSSEYNKLISTLNAIDVHRWVASIKKDTTHKESNIRFTKDTFTFIISKKILENIESNKKSQILFEDHKTIIICSNVNKYIVDMNYFTNFPEDTIFMLYKPNVKLVNNKSLYELDKLIVNSNEKNNIKKISTVTDDNSSNDGANNEINNLVNNNL